MDIQTVYQETIKYAAEKHGEINQKIPGTDITYVVHLSNVAMEILIASFHSENFNLYFAIQVALLHDILEDTKTSFHDLQNKFGNQVSSAVQALTKNDYLKDKSHKMEDSLQRIKLQPKEVWSVKLADRITNLQTPPKHWSEEKIKAYCFEAEQILLGLKNANPFLEKRLELKIVEYRKLYVS